MIKTEDIKRLLDRYYDGTTTEEEEKTLSSLRLASMLLPLK